MTSTSANFENPYRMSLSNFSDELISKGKGKDKGKSLFGGNKLKLMMKIIFKKA